MQAFVFTDESLARHAGRFVWLSMDGEKAKNAALRGRLALVGYPSFYVVDPASERVALRWVGSFTAAQLPRLLDAGETAVRGGRSDLDRRLIRADSLYALGRDSAAADAYAAVLAATPPRHPQVPRVTESLVFALSQAGRHAEAVQRAVGALPGLGRTPSAASVAAGGLAAALALPPDHPDRVAQVPTLETATAAFTADTTLGIADDDRSGLYIGLLEARSAAGDSLGARRVAGEWAAFLDRAAARAATPAQRVVFDSHRLSAAIEIGAPERAIPLLEQSQRDFPDDYNPPARLAVAYKELKRWDEALAASDRALARVYGPRQLGVWRTRVDILIGRGDREGAREALRRAIAAGKALPAGQVSRATLAGLEQRLAALDEGR